MKMKNDMPYDFWNYGINPILGYRYMPDGNHKPNFMKRKKNQDESVSSL